MPGLIEVKLSPFPLSSKPRCVTFGTAPGHSKATEPGKVVGFEERGKDKLRSKKRNKMLALGLVILTVAAMFIISLGQSPRKGKRQ
jgi:hypothetical protein